MKRLNFLQGLLLLLIVVLSIPLTIVEEIGKFIFSLPRKIKFNYQIMMFMGNLSK
jgi:hypothetical protein